MDSEELQIKLKRNLENEKLRQSIENMNKDSTTLSNLTCNELCAIMVTIATAIDKSGYTKQILNPTKGKIEELQSMGYKVMVDTYNISDRNKEI